MEAEDRNDSFAPKSRQFTYSEVQKITNNFERVLGKGGFGEVYHGCLDDNQQVAVKMLSSSSAQGYKEFHAEVYMNDLFIPKIVEVNYISQNEMLFSIAAG